MRGSKVQYSPRAMSAAALLVVAAVAVVVCSSRTTVAAVSCNDAISALIPCGSYLVGQGGAQPSSQCCESARALDHSAATAASRRQLCECLKQTGPSFGVKPDRAQQLPPLCKLTINIAITPTVDCNRIA